MKLLRFLLLTCFSSLAVLVCFLAVVPFLAFPNLLQQLKKMEAQKKITFAFEGTEVNFPSADWLSYLRTKLTVFVDGVCLQSRQNFPAPFSRNNFFTRRRHFKELRVKGNLFHCSQIETIPSLKFRTPISREKN